MVKKVPKLALWQNILWRNVIRNYDYEVQTSYTLFWFFIFLLLCLHYVTDWSKNWNYVYWLLLFLIGSKYVYAQISVPKIGIPTSKRCRKESVSAPD